MPVALCSNASEEFINEILDTYQLRDLFSTIVISSTIGIAKPDAGIYNETLRQLGLSASDVLFIDDNPTNISGAEKVGIKGIVFTSAAQLKDELEKISVLPKH
jgi:HAD superfamily hydrolase (TIGR01509 family)